MTETCRHKAQTIKAHIYIVRVNLLGLQILVEFFPVHGAEHDKFHCFSRLTTTENKSWMLVVLGLQQLAFPKDFQYKPRENVNTFL
jgi:hypothetical protein